jgi:hypothetical protein
MGHELQVAQLRQYGNADRADQRLETFSLYQKQDRNKTI